MAQAALVVSGPIEVDIVEVISQGLQLRSGNAWRLAVLGGKTEFMLGLREGQPKPSPDAELSLRAPKGRHFSTGIPRGKEVFRHKRGILDWDHASATRPSQFAQAT